MADVQWIRIDTDIFNNWKIKTIKAMPEGHKMICIWVQLLCIAGARNEHGMIVFPTQMCTTDDILATVIGEDKLVVQMALEVFSKLGMITVDNDNALIQISNWQEYQNVDGLEKIRKKGAERQAKFREKQKMLLEKTNISENDETESNDDSDNNFDYETAWKKTYEIYPKRRNSHSAKTAWLDILKIYSKSKHFEIAHYIFKATKRYVDDYKKQNPNDDTFRFIPTYDVFLKEDCEFYMQTIEQEERSND